MTIKHNACIFNSTKAPASIGNTKQFPSHSGSPSPSGHMLENGSMPTCARNTRAKRYPEPCLRKIKCEFSHAPFGFARPTNANMGIFLAACVLIAALLCLRILYGLAASWRSLKKKICQKKNKAVNKRLPTEPPTNTHGGELVCAARVITQPASRCGAAQAIMPHTGFVILTNNHIRTSRLLRCKQCGTLNWETNLSNGLCKFCRNTPPDEIKPEAPPKTDCRLDLRAVPRLLVPRPPVVPVLPSRN